MLFERLIAEGDLRAFDQLWERYERPLFAFVRTRLGDAAEAEDVLHDAFMAVLRERGRRSDVRSFRAWLYQVAHNLCLNRLRSRKRAGRALDGVSEISDTVTEPTAELAIDERARAARLSQAVERLPPALADVYRLRAAGLSYDEIAASLDVPLGTVKSRLNQLLGLLREEMSR